MRDQARASALRSIDKIVSWHVNISVIISGPATRGRDYIDTVHKQRSLERRQCSEFAAP